MGYPVAYRTQAARVANRLSRGGGPLAPPRPANDNVPRGPAPFSPPIPANDNFPIVEAAPELLQFAGRQMRWLRPLMRLNPWIAGLLLLPDLWQLYLWMQGGGKVPTDWTLCWSCTTGQPPLLANRLGGIAGFGIDCASAPGPATCGSFGSFTPADFSVHGVIAIQDQHPFVSTFPIVAGIYVAPSPQTHPPEDFQDAVSIPHLVPEPLPWERFPWLNPEAMPIGRPVPPPEPIPYPRIPGRPMHPDTDRGYSPPGEAPRVSPGPVTIGTTPFAEPIGRRRPPRGEREKKYRITSWAGRIHAALSLTARVHGKMTDLRDLIKAMHDSLPKELQLKGKDRGSPTLDRAACG